MYVEYIWFVLYFVPRTMTPLVAKEAITLSLLGLGIAVGGLLILMAFTVLLGFFSRRFPTASSSLANEHDKDSMEELDDKELAAVIAVSLLLKEISAVSSVNKI